MQPQHGCHTSLRLIASLAETYKAHAKLLYLLRAIILAFTDTVDNIVKTPRSNYGHPRHSTRHSNPHVIVIMDIHTNPPTRIIKTTQALHQPSISKY